MKLFAAPGTIALAPALALLEADVPHDIHRIDFAKAEQTTPDYGRINPRGRVPALVLDSGAILTETGAILEYIGSIQPEAGLIPKDPEIAAHMRAVMYYLASTMHVAHAHKMRGARWADHSESHADMTAKVPQTMAACAAFIEKNALRAEYTCGDRPSLADLYLFVVCSWLPGDGVPLAPYPALDAFQNRMAQRPSVATLRDQGLL